MAADVGAANGLYQLVYICDRLPPITVSKETFTFGRAQECDLSFNTCKFLSGNHCNITRDVEGKVWLYDTSTNGTLVNGNKVKKGQSVQLNHNDLIHLVHRKDLNIGFMYQDLKCLQEESTDITLDHTQEYETTDTEANTPVLSDDHEECQEKQPSKSQESQPGKRSHKECASTSEAEGPTPKRQHSDSEKKEDTGDSSSKPKLTSSNSMAETLLCSICQDIFHDCISLQPCMHSFCASCYSQWMAHSNECPSCRTHVGRINKNHIVNNLVEVFLKEHPEKRRPDDELKEMDAKNKITSDMLKPPRRRLMAGVYPLHLIPDDDDYDDENSDSDHESLLTSSSNSYDDDDDDDDDNNAMQRIISIGGSSATTFGGLFGFSSGSRVPPPVCRQCPSYVPPASGATPTTGPAPTTGPDTAGASCSSAAGVASSSTSAPTPPSYVCPSSRTHILCMCCMQYMPDRRNEASAARADGVTIPQMTCCICRRAFCHMYWGCRGPGCQGCLNQFKDLKFGDRCLPTLINNNTSESTILKDYLTDKGITLADLTKTCLEKLDSKAYTSADSARCNLTSSSVTCYKCGLRNFQDLAYQYRRDIPADQLPASVTSKPKCYWGKNCRTQKTKSHHAARFNHICEQTRFT